MKTKLFFFALIAVFALSACSSDDVDSTKPIEKGETRSVYLKMKTSNNRSLRSLEPSQDGSSATLLSAIIYFLDGSADPVIYAVRTAGSTGDILLSDLEDGYEFSDIPSSATQVYIVGNYNSSDSAGDTSTFPSRDGQLLSEIESVVLNIEQVVYGELADGTTSTGLLTVMSGQAPIEDFDTNPGDWNGDPLSAGDLYANVEISPINSRIEIEQISYSGALASFTIEGIYINNYYQNLPLDLDRTGYAPLNNGSDTLLYDRTNAAFAYDYYISMFDRLDEDITPAAGAATLTPTQGTYAYHVFGNSSPVPHIILKLTNVTLGTVNLGTRYVTVTGFRNGGGQEVGTFLRNRIYRIADLAFTDEDLTIRPETELIDVWVLVEVADWITVDVTPII